MPGNSSENPVPSVANVANAPLPRSGRPKRAQEHSHANDSVRVIAEDIRAIGTKVCLLQISQSCSAECG